MNLAFASISRILLVVLFAFFVLRHGRDVEEIHLLKDFLDGEALPSRHVGIAVSVHVACGMLTNH